MRTVLLPSLEHEIRIAAAVDIRHDGQPVTNSRTIFRGIIVMDSSQNSPSAALVEFVGSLRQNLCNMNVSVVLVDYGCNLDPSVLRAVAEATTIQMQRDFGRPVPYGFGVTATVRVAKNQNDIRKNEWVLEYRPKLKLEPGDPLGYHDRNSNGLPRMVVFPFLDDPHMRGLVESHEIIETLADPWMNKVIPDLSGRLIACEPADPVEPSWYPIAVRGGWVPVSNFVSPAYYLPLHFPNVQYDFLGQLRYPGEILPGGFLSTLSPGSGGKWSQQTNGFRRPYRSLNHPFTRSSRRARGRI